MVFAQQNDHQPQNEVQSTWARRQGCIFSPPVKRGQTTPKAGQQLTSLTGTSPSAEPPAHYGSINADWDSWKQTFSLSVKPSSPIFLPIRKILLVSLSWDLLTPHLKRSCAQRAFEGQPTLEIWLSPRLCFVVLHAMAWTATVFLSHPAGWFLPQNQILISALFCGHRNSSFSFGYHLPVQVQILWVFPTL